MLDQRGLLMRGVIAAIDVRKVCIGLLVAIPVASLFLVYSWRRLTGGPIAPLTP